VRKKYVGTGELAEALAHSDETIRLIRKLEREKEREELERLKALAAPVLELDEVAKVLARAHLVAGGFRKRRGEWRRERTT
jgi:pyridoxal biosynthesis lyase PdxS